MEQRIQWFEKYDKDTYPIYVAERQEKVVGYCTLSPFRPGRQGMAGIAEISYFLDFAVHGQGIGSALIRHAINDCERIGKKTLIAILLDINPKSSNILKEVQIRQMGSFPQCGGPGWENLQPSNLWLEIILIDISSDMRTLCKGKYFAGKIVTIHQPKKQDFSFYIC